MTDPNGKNVWNWVIRRLNLTAAMIGKGLMSQRLPAKCVMELSIPNDRRRYSLLPASNGEQNITKVRVWEWLSQQVQITCQLNPASAYWLTNSSGTPAAIPAAFDIAYFQVEQLQMKDRGMALANRINMNEHMYSMPLPTLTFESSVCVA